MLSDRCLSVLSVCDVGVLRSNGWMDQDETWHAGRPRPWPHCVRWRHSSPPPKGHSPQLSAHVYCRQTAAWNKMPLGTEVGLGPDDIVLDGDPAPPHQKGGKAPSLIFGPCLLWSNGWMDQDGTWHGVGLGPGHTVQDGDPALPQNGRAAALFSAHVYCSHGRPSQLLLSSCCTAHGRVPIGLVYNGPPLSPSKLPLCMGDSDPHLIHGSLGPSQSTIKTASRSVQAFVHGSRS